MNRPENSFSAQEKATEPDEFLESGQDDAVMLLDREAERTNCFSGANCWRINSLPRLMPGCKMDMEPVSLFDEPMPPKKLREAWKGSSPLFWQRCHYVYHSLAAVPIEKWKRCQWWRCFKLWRWVIVLGILLGVFS